MKFDKNLLNSDNIQNKKIRKTVKRIIKKYTLDDVAQIGVLLTGTSLAVKLNEKLKECGL